MLANCVAPGMDATFSLIFTPLEEDGDYACEIEAHTEREAFVVPVKAFGVRAVLDFPDRVAWDDAPVRYSSTKTLLVRNIGMFQKNLMSRQTSSKVYVEC